MYIPSASSFYFTDVLIDDDLLLSLKSNRTPKLIILTYHNDVVPFNFL